MLHGPPLAYADHGHQSLLHFLALRLPYSPNTLDLARYLLAHGVDDPKVEDEPPPLIQAAQIGFFELGDMLVKYKAGGSLDMMHSRSSFLMNPNLVLAWTPDEQTKTEGTEDDSEKERYTLLGCLIPSQTSPSFGKIAYLS